MRDYLDKEQTLRFKGILCLIVVFAHSNDSFLSTYGLWAVAPFFFLSGYILSLTTKDKPLTPGLVFHKYRNFLLPFLIVAIPYHVMYHFYPCIYDYNSVWGAVKHAFLFHPTVQAGWYIIALTMLFTMYFIALNLSKGDSKKLILIMTFLYAVYVIYAAFIAHADYAYQNAHAFILGVWFQRYREGFAKFYKGKKVLGYSLLFTSYLSVLIPLLCQDEADREQIWGKILLFIFYNFSVILFLYFAYGFRLKSPVAAFFGKYSLWIYLTHVGVQYMLMNILPLWGIKVSWIVLTFFLATLAVSTAISLLIAIPYNIINRKLST